MTSYLDYDGLATLAGEIDDNYVSRSASSVGSGTKPVYVASGAVTASSSTVGSSSNPVYMSSGTITACDLAAGAPPIAIARGSASTSTTKSLTADTVTQLTLLSSTLAAYNSDDIFSVESGGILDDASDYGNAYLVSASAYVKPAAACTRVDVFIYMDEADSPSFSNAEEVASACTATDGTTSSLTVSIPPVLVESSNDSVGFFLAVRCRSGSGTLYSGNASTYLQVQRLC